MKITLTAAEFMRAAKLAQPVIKKKNRLPILAGALITVENRRAVLSGTNLDIWIDIPLTTRIAQKGQVVLDFHAAMVFVKKLPPATEITIKSLKGAARITAELDGVQAAWAADSGYVPEEFTAARPDLPAEEGGDLTLPAPTLRRILGRCLFAASDMETRYYLQGVFLQWEDARLVSVATDGHRMALLKTRLPDAHIPPVLEGGVIIARESIPVITVALPVGEDPCRLTFAAEKHYITFHRADGLTIHAKTIDGTFPNYKQVIPAYKKKAVATAGRSDVKRLIRMAWPRGVKLTASKGRLIAESANANATICAEITAAYAGPKVTLGLNPDLAASIMGAIEGETITLTLDPTREGGQVCAPVQFTATDDPDFMALLMPMRV